MVDQHQQDAAAKASAEQLAKQTEENRKVQARAVDARLAAKEKSVQELNDLQENLQPTPTQRECDLARVGALDNDDKEDDGSEWEDEAHQRVMAARLPGNNPYDTRDMSAAESGRARRGGRRKSK